jgi:hypothetical protein
MDGRRLRLWPGLAAVLVQWLVRFVMPMAVPEAAYTALLGGVAGGLVVLLWWVLFSRAAWSERLFVVTLVIAGLALTPLVLDKSIATAGMGVLFPISLVPFLSLAIVVGAVLSRRFSD